MQTPNWSCLCLPLGTTGMSAIHCLGCLISTGGGWGKLWFLAQPALRCEGGLALKPAGASPIEGPCIWLTAPKDCPRHRVGAGRWAWGLGSACGFVWDKGDGEERQGSLVGLGLVLDWVTGRWSKQAGTCFILRCDQRQTHDHCCSSVGHLFTFWYLLLSVVALKLTLGTSGLGGHSHPGEPEARPRSSRIPWDVSKLLIWPWTETGLN